MRIHLLGNRKAELQILIEMPESIAEGDVFKAIVRGLSYNGEIKDWVKQCHVEFRPDKFSARNRGAALPPGKTLPIP